MIVVALLLTALRVLGLLGAAASVLAAAILWEPGWFVVGILFSIAYVGGTAAMSEIDESRSR